MEFSPANPVIQLCLQGMQLAEQGKAEEAIHIFQNAWKTASNNLEKFMAAYFIANQQKKVADKLEWLQIALEIANRVNDHAVKAAFGPLHKSIAACYVAMNDPENAGKHHALADALPSKPSDPGPFFHGTKADLKVGDLLIPGFQSNYQSDLTMNHIYFTAMPNGAGLAAALAKGEGQERVYIVEPNGPFEDDPNVTNKKFPGNPTRSYRTLEPLKITGEATDWTRQSEEERQKWREKLDKNDGEIIN